MLVKRIIPCLDIKNGRTVKGTNFINLRDAGDPVELAEQYSKAGADELVFLDITATHEKRKTMAELARKVAEKLSIPFTIGGGISSIQDAEVLLEAGADKISVNSSAVRKPALINELAKAFGQQFVVVAIDAKQIDNKWFIHLNGGRVPTEKELMSWTKEVVERGAGEILFTSMDHDGTKNGFADDVYAQINEFINIPIIASGGAGTMDHFVNVFKKGKADAALAASIFHFKEIEIIALKKYLQSKQIPVRL
jgi:cyclase